ncbi:MAG: YceI family protein [Chitinophagaceae bacterium]|nr:YceI family protein [Chitinophagaceae bacterium]
MKLIAFFCCSLLSLCPQLLLAQSYIPSDNGSTVTFVIKNLGFSVDGSFKNLQGSIKFDPNTPEAAIFMVTVDAATINTDNGSRDKHLRKEEYFDVAKYPKISFSSDKLDKTATAGLYIAKGKFTVKGISKSVAMSFTAKAQNGGYLFNGKVVLNRRDFKVGGNSLVLSDYLTLTLNVFAPQG